uniref:transcription termination factor 2-like n=1 Tax=Styela clava TaxID=7725 RepID=UPI00193AA407|nr:transcription termination factor 2-like [Styela clava]
MAEVSSSNSNDHSHNRKALTVGTRYCGTVTVYKEDKGYGFFSVPNHDNVFFHMTTMRNCGITSGISRGDKFCFDVKEHIGRDSKLDFRAEAVTRLERNHQMQNQDSRKQTHKHDKHQHGTYSNGNSGAFVSIPHPHDVKVHGKKEVSSKHGEIVEKNLYREKHERRPKPKPIDLSSGKIRVGPPCVVPAMRKGPIVVSATGPNSAEMAPRLEDSEVVRLKENIGKKKTLFRSLKLDKLPDGGRRLKDEINNLELELQKLSMKSKNKDKSHDSTPSKLIDKENQLPLSNADAKPKHTRPWLESYSRKPDAQGAVMIAPPMAFNSAPDRKLTQTKLTFPKAEPFGGRTGKLDLSAYDMGPMQFNDGPLYGGRMTSARLTEVRQITKAAIEDLHKSLETRPEPTGELDDPDGLKVTLMTHQRQALAWLVWREQQSMSGGILADDMGLGKTLTMICLILKQRELSDENKDSKIQIKEEDDIKDFNSSSESDDSVILIENEKTESKIKREVKGGSKEESDIGETEKTPLIESDSTLIIAPASLLFHWEKEIRNRCDKGLLSIHLFHGSSREKEPSRLAEFDVIITTYDIVRRCLSAKAEEKKENTLMQIKWNRIILDEAHQIKNFKSQSSEAACKLEAKSRWAMSGTPVQNNLTDMYAMLKFLHCRPFDEYKVWKHQVDNKTTNGKERLKTLVSCIVLRREKSQSDTFGKPLVNLPKRTFVTHKLKLNDVEREVYQKLQSDSQAAFRKFQDNKKHPKSSASGHLGSSSKGGNNENKMTATTLLVMLLRLRQCCGHLNLLKQSFDPELLSNEKKEMALEDMFQTMDINKTPVKMADINLASYVGKNKSKYFDKSSMSGKLEFVLDELNKLRFEKPDDKCVIVSQWTSMLEVVAYHLELSNMSYVIIKGSVPAKKRMDMVDDFNRNPVNPKIILLSLQAGGVGLNLIGGNHLFMLDMHWNPALENQAFDRVYRVGQTKPVFVHKFVVEDTVEERILKLQEHKLSIAKAVMDGAGLEDRKKLTLQDMKLLFGI